MNIFCIKLSNLLKFKYRVCPLSPAQIDITISEVVCFWKHLTGMNICSTSYFST